MPFFSEGTSIEGSSRGSRAPPCRPRRRSRPRAAGCAAFPDGVPDAGLNLGWAGWAPAAANSCQILEGSFSAAWKPIFATKYSLCKIFQALGPRSWRSSNAGRSDVQQVNHNITLFFSSFDKSSRIWKNNFEMIIQMSSTLFVFGEIV